MATSIVVPTMTPLPSPTATPVVDVLAVTFRILHTDCGVAPALFDLLINDVPVGSVLGTPSCDCTGDVLEVTLTDAAALALIDPSLCNRFTVAVNAGSATTRMGFVQVTLQTTDGSQQACLFDGSATNPAPACAARPLCDPPGFSEGAAAVAGTLCPVCGGDVLDPIGPHPDLDDDRIGNTCDAADAMLRVRRGRVRGNTHTKTVNGTVVVRGDVIFASPDDRLDAAGGIAVQVTDGLSLDESFAWAADECLKRRSGYISCRSPDGQWRGTFNPRAPSGLYRFALRFGRLESRAPFQPPLTVRVTDHPPLAIVGIDRIGTIDSCSITKNGMRCLVP